MPLLQRGREIPYEKEELKDLPWRHGEHGVFLYYFTNN